MGDLPSKFDRLMQILEVVAKKKTVTLNEIAKSINSRISSIGIYIDYLEELGLIYTEHDGKRTVVHILDNVVTRIGTTMIAVYKGQVVAFRCPFREICDYYRKGCPSVEDCLFLQSFLPAIEEALANHEQKTQPQLSEQSSEEQ